MQQKIRQFDIVFIRCLDMRIGSVRDFSDDNDIPTCQVICFNGELIEIPDNQLELTGISESPLRHFEVVEVSSGDKEYLAINGQRGVINSIGLDEKNYRWHFTVVLQNGECWGFERTDLAQTGIYLTEEQVYGNSDPSVVATVQVNRETHSGVIIESNPNLIHQAPTPLLIDLEML